MAKEGDGASSGAAGQDALMDLFYSLASHDPETRCRTAKALVDQLVAAGGQMPKARTKAASSRRLTTVEYTHKRLVRGR